MRGLRLSCAGLRVAVVRPTRRRSAAESSSIRRSPEPRVSYHRVSPTVASVHAPRGIKNQDTETRQTKHQADRRGRAVGGISPRDAGDRLLDGGVHSPGPAARPQREPVRLAQAAPPRRLLHLGAGSRPAQWTDNARAEAHRGPARRLALGPGPLRQGTWGRAGRVDHDRQVHLPDLVRVTGRPAVHVRGDRYRGPVLSVKTSST